MDEGVRKQTAEVVQTLLDKAAETMKEGGVKATLADYLRLVQLRRELDEDEPKNIEVKWVDPEEKDGSCEK